MSQPVKIDLDLFLAKFRQHFDMLINFVPVPLCTHYYLGREHIENNLESLKFHRRIQIICKEDVDDQPLNVFLIKAQMISQMEVGAFVFKGNPIVSGAATDDPVTQGEYTLIKEAQAKMVSSTTNQLISLGYTSEVLHQISIRLENQLHYPTLRNFELAVEETDK